MNFRESSSQTQLRIVLMKTLWKTALVGSLALTGCSTELYDPSTGHCVARIRGDATKLHLVVGGITFDAETLDHSTPTISAGHAWNMAFHALTGFAAALAAGFGPGASVIASHPAPAALAAVGLAGASVAHKPAPTPAPVAMRRAQ